MLTALHVGSLQALRPEIEAQHIGSAMSYASTLSPPAYQSVVVRALPTTTVEEREAILKDVEYNIFNFPAGLLTVDFLTDSGTSAMTDVQWAACENPGRPLIRGNH